MRHIFYELILKYETESKTDLQPHPLESNDGHDARPVTILATATTKYFTKNQVKIWLKVKV